MNKMCTSKILSMLFEMFLQLRYFAQVCFPKLLLGKVSGCFIDLGHLGLQRNYWKMFRLSFEKSPMLLKFLSCGSWGGNKRRTQEFL